MKVRVVLLSSHGLDRRQARRARRRIAAALTKTHAEETRDA